MDLLNDLRFGTRALMHHRGFATAAIAILALGIGINTAVFTVTNTVLFRGFPHVDPDNRILYLSKSGCCEISYPDFDDWRKQAKSFSGIGVVSSGGLRLILSDERGGSETCDGTKLSVNSFAVLGHRPALGRDFAPSDATPGGPAVAVLSYSFWERRYGKDASVIGKNIRLDKVPTTVIGVMPPGFDFPHHRVDVWVPLVTTAELMNRQNRSLWFAFGRMANGTTLQSAQAEMDGISRRLEAAYPATNRDVRTRVATFQQFFLGANAATLYGAMWGAVGFVLLIACANLATLLLARAIGRVREVSIRMALGARRSQILRQLLVESVILSSAGGILGWLFGLAVLRVYEVLGHPPESYDRWIFTLDYRVLFYLVAISLTAGLIFGLAPAIRLASLDVNTGLRGGGHGTTSGGSAKRLSSLLVAGETAVAVVLLAGAGLMIRSFLNVYTADTGVKAENLLTAYLELPAGRYPGAPSQFAFFEELQMKVRNTPGVESVAVANSLPGLYAPRVAYELRGLADPEERRRLRTAEVVINPEYFRTTGAALISGRAFNEFDNRKGSPVIIVNERFAASSWPGENAAGKEVRLFNGKTASAWRTVVGVASNIIQNDATAQKFDPVVYVPFGQSPTPYMAVLVRTRVPPESLESSLRREIQGMDPDLVIGSGLGSIGGPKPLQKSLAFNYWSSGVNAMLFFVFAAIALLLTIVGLYGVVSHSVARRIREIGVRMAVGATPADILRLVMVQGILPSGGGLALGLAGCMVVTRVLDSQLIHVTANDPVTLVAASVALIVPALLGCLIPALRAMRLDPVAALRNE